MRYEEQKEGTPRKVERARRGEETGGMRSKVEAEGN
jgi:hypothetical protein